MSTDVAVQRDLTGMLEGELHSTPLHAEGAAWTALKSSAHIMSLKHLGDGGSANQRSARVWG